MPNKLIYHKDDREQVADLRLKVTFAERRLETAVLEAEGAKGTPQREGDDVPDGVRVAKDALQAAQIAFDDFVDVAEGRAEMWTLEPIGHEEFRNLLRDHPPRKVTEGEGDAAKEVPHPDDVDWGFNTETFPKALLLFVDPDDDEVRTVTEPKFATEAAFRKRVKRLSDGEFMTMWVIAYQANTGLVADLKALRFSPVDPRFAAT
jgi:hypothetical protein